MCLKADKISGTLRGYLSVFHIAVSDIHSLTMQRTRSCVSMVKLSVFIALLRATYVRRQYKWKIFLSFHGKSG
jgi:hypothetical protein